MSQSKAQLKLDWCSHEAAKYAVEHWHYSRCLPFGKLIKIGVWEDGKFIGCVLFGRGASAQIGKPYNLPQTQICELVRVALTEHKTLTSRILSVALKFLKTLCPGLRLIVSYADSQQGHVGGIYQATNWLYVGPSFHQSIKIHGKILRTMSVTGRYGTQSIPWLQKHVDPYASIVHDPPKHKYLYPLDDEIRQRVLPLAKPYPKKSRATSIEGDASGDPTGRGGINATVALLSRIEEAEHV